MTALCVSWTKTVEPACFTQTAVGTLVSCASPTLTCSISSAAAVLGSRDEMPIVWVKPSGIVFDAEPGATIMGAAEATGLRWPTVCGGLGTCRTCVVRVLAGAAGLSPVHAWEAEGLDEARVTVQTGDETIRLACQARLGEADVVVYKTGVRHADLKNSERKQPTD